MNFIPRNLFLLFLVVILFSSYSIGAFVHQSTAMSTDSLKDHQKSMTQQHPLMATDQNKEGKGEEPILQLPEASDDPSIPSIKLGESIRFEEMGPVIINIDGTTRRIDNWDQMTKAEQEVAWRRIAKRNEERRKALLEQQTQMNEGGN
jgi:hypothetical protein